MWEFVGVFAVMFGSWLPAFALGSAARRLAAWLLGFRMRRVPAGKVLALRRPGGERVDVWRELRGRVFAVTDRPRAWRWRYACLCLAAPVANLALGLGAIGVARTFETGIAAIVACGFGLANVIFVLAGPSTDTEPSALLRTIRQPAAALRDRMVLALEAELLVDSDDARTVALVTFEPRNFFGNWNLGEAHLQAERWPEARDHLRRAAAARAPYALTAATEATILNSLAWATLRAGGPYDEALASAEAALALAPDNPAFLDTCGEARVRCGRVEEGMPLLERAWAVVSGPGEPTEGGSNGVARAHVASSLALGSRLRGDLAAEAHWAAIARANDARFPEHAGGQPGAGP